MTYINNWWLTSNLFKQLSYDDNWKMLRNDRINRPEKILRPKKARLFPYRYDSDDRAEFQSACWEQKLYLKNTQEWIKFIEKLFKPFSTGMTHFRPTFFTVMRNRIVGYFAEVRKKVWVFLSIGKSQFVMNKVGIKNFQLT